MLELSPSHWLAHVCWVRHLATRNPDEALAFARDAAERAPVGALSAIALEVHFAIIGARKRDRYALYADVEQDALAYAAHPPGAFEIIGPEMRACVVDFLTESCPATYFQKADVRSELDAVAARVLGSLLAGQWQSRNPALVHATNLIACALWLADRRQQAAAALRIVQSSGMHAHPWGVFSDNPLQAVAAACNDCGLGRDANSVHLRIPLEAVIPPPPPVAPGAWFASGPVETLPRAAFILIPSLLIPPAFVSAGVTPADLDAFIAAVNASDVDPGGMISARCCRRKGALLAPGMVAQIAFLTVASTAGTLTTAMVSSVYGLISAGSPWSAYAIVVGCILGAGVLGIALSVYLIRACGQRGEDRAAARLCALATESMDPAFATLRRRGVAARLVRVERDAVSCEGWVVRCAPPPTTWEFDLALSEGAGRPANATTSSVDAIARLGGPSESSPLIAVQRC